MAEARKRYYILLQDRVGKMQERSVLAFGGMKSTPTQVLKGELLEALPETEQPNDSTRIALAGIDRKSLRLECRTEDITRLTMEDANLLLAISSVGLRYQSFIDRKRLDFGRHLSPGSQVFVDVKGISKKLHGTVWYVGELIPLHGTMFGVELIKNPGQGTSDGTFRNKTYFKCPPDSGVFVSLDKLTPIEDSDSKPPKSPKRDESSPSSFASRMIPSLFKGKNDHEQKVHVPRKGADYKVQIDERVVTFAGDAPVRGTVRYIGEDKGSHGQVHTFVGLELDARCGNGTGKLKGKQLFVCKRDYAIFVDIETVIPEKDFDQDPAKDVTSPDRGEMMSKSVGYDPSRYSGHESVKKVKRTTSFDSADHNLIVAAGESSQTDCAAFIEQQKHLLHEYKSTNVSLPTKRDVRMSNDERTDSAGNMNFSEDHFKNTPPNSDLKTPPPITKQPGLSVSNVRGRSYHGFVNIEKEDYEELMQPHEKDPVSPMASDHEVVSDNYSPVETNNMENSAVSKEPAEAQTSVVHVDEQASDKMTDLEAQAIAEIPHGFEVGSMVEVPMAQGLPRYGVIKWIGTLPTLKDKLVAGLELEDEQSACSDGTFGGERYFSCPSGRGFFTLLAHCRQDSRFTPNSPISDPDYQSSKAFGSLPSPEVKGVTIPESSLLDDHCGSMKGLQGHHNSCYLDATLYAMFAFSMVFDTLLHKEKKQDDLPEYEDVQHVLREAIVNPLRTFGFVRADRILKLRELLDKLSSTAGLVNEEKDPEEFLNSLLKQVLKADPFLHLKSRDERKKDSEGAFFYQIITEKNEAVKIPMVQELLEQSFLSADIILSEVPSCLILQMPRFGSKYKMYDMILPDLELDVTHIVENVARECTVCGSEPAQFECKMCYQKGVVADRAGMPSYCGGCNGKIHGHRDRQHHKTRPVILPRQFKNERWMLDKQKMELFAVVCIETSHYVAFVKCGDGVDKSWCFFDSMADRKGERNGYNIPAVTRCPEALEWLSKDPKEIIAAKERGEIPEKVRRLLGDAYLCMYQNLEMTMYK